METLVSISEAAQILNLSVQGVHYRIKKGLIKSKKQDGKTFVYVNNASSYTKNETTTHQKEDKNAILLVKEEQIKQLKESIEWMKNRYEAEIKRLETNQTKIIDVLNSEIKLLQSAFNEMRSIYKIELKNAKKTHQKEDNQPKGLIDLKDFFKLMQKYGKNNQEIKKIILQAIVNKDKRFIYNKKSNKIIIFESDFSDLI